MQRKSVHDRSLDEELGAKLRYYRTLRKFSQTRLAEGVGLTFQQIQKYEKGANRISVSRLMEFAEILDFSVKDFLADFDREPEDGSYRSHIKLLGQSFVVDSITSLASIKNSNKRQALSSLIDQIAADDKTS